MEPSEKFENINHLVLNFYSDGYTVAVKLNEFPFFTSETICETARISYEETSLLDYIENKELPPLLVDIIDRSPKLNQYKIWYNGCLVVEIRNKIDWSENNISNESLDLPLSELTANDLSPLVNDKFLNSTVQNSFNNNSSFLDDADEFLFSENFITDSNNYTDQFNNISCPNSNSDQIDQASLDEFSSLKKYQSYFVLLKPTNLSVLSDVVSLTESSSWTDEDRLQLESQIVLHNSAPLCLETTTANLIQQQQDETSLPECPKLTVGIINGIIRYSSENLFKMMGITCNDQSTIDQKQTYYNMPLYLPPEFSLQQFLTSRKTSRKKNASFINQSRFQRHRKNPSKLRI